GISKGRSQATHRAVGCLRDTQSALCDGLRLRRNSQRLPLPIQGVPVSTNEAGATAVVCPYGGLKPAALRFRCRVEIPRVTRHLLSGFPNSRAISRVVE